MNRADLHSLVATKILTGGRRTKAVDAREVLDEAIDSLLVKDSDLNVAGGYLGIDNDGIVDISFIKSAAPSGLFLKDDGSWAAAGGGGSADLATVLGNGNITGGNDINISAGDYIAMLNFSAGWIYSDASEGSVGWGNNYFYGNSTGSRIKYNNSPVFYADAFGTGLIALDTIDLIAGTGGFVNNPDFINITHLAAGGGIKLQADIIQATSDISFLSGYGIDSVATGGSDVLNIGATNANIINYGNASTIHNFLGFAIYELQVNSYVEDKLVTYNYGGAIASGIGVGFEIEEDSVITGYFKTNAGRTGFLLKAPASYELDLWLDGLTADRAIEFPDADGVLMLRNGTLTSGSKILVGSDATYDFWYNGGSGAITRLATANSSMLVTSAGGVPSWLAQASAFNKAFGTASGTITEGNDTRIIKDEIVCNLDGYGSVIAVSTNAINPAMSSGATITGWYIEGDVSGSIVVDIKKNGTSMPGGGGNKPALSGAVTANASVSGWTSTTYVANDKIEIYVVSASTLTKCWLVLKTDITS